MPPGSDDEVPDAPDAEEEERADDDDENDDDAEEQHRPRPRQGAATGGGNGNNSNRAGGGGGGGAGGKGKAAAATTTMVLDDDDEFDDPFADDDDDEAGRGGSEGKDQPKRIPPELLRRLLHEFFDKGGTRISSEANGALARYFDVFVQEAIARTMAERSGRFLGVEDLEKVAPQLLLDL